MKLPILSHFQAKEILQAMQSGKREVQVSLDLGLTTTPFLISSHEVIFPDGQKLSYKQLKKILKHENKCYFVRENELEPINVFSKTTGWMRTLYPTKSAPTTLVSGFLMHRVKDIDPLEHVRRMVESLRIQGDSNVLDTCFGLGYGAQELAKTGNVVTVEIDPSAIELARINPWSSPLFSDSNIEVVAGDIQEVVESFEDNQFTHILHDPPTFKLAGELYSLDFYTKLYRVLKSGGILFHYIGDPDSALGASVTKGVIERLKRSGFSNILKKPTAFGIISMK